MEPVIDAKRSALINFKRDPSQRNNATLRAARNKAKQTARYCPNNYIGYNSARASRHRLTREISGAYTMELRRQHVQQ